MNDRELLELAAKAAGIKLYWEPYLTNSGKIFRPHLEIDGTWGHGEWNPLEYDGDALRLAVRCKIAVNPMTVDGLNRDQHESTAGCVKRWTSCIERHDGDPLAATRRAITRAAAELGRAL